MIREITGHCSDALDRYEVTSEDQKIHISNVLAGNETVNSPKQQVTDSKVRENETITSECSCNKKVMKMQDAPKIGEIIGDIMKQKKGRKTLVKIEIEFTE